MKEFNVVEGQSVTKGQRIGLSGGGKNDPYKGTSTGPHIHSGIIKGKHSSVPSKANKHLFRDIEKFDFTILDQVVQNAKSNEEIAREVINGKWGNGADRKNRLTIAGYNADSIQKLVNVILSNKKPKPKLKSNEEIAREVRLGRWGNGKARKDALTKAGYNFNTIQAIVNK